MTTIPTPPANVVEGTWEEILRQAAAFGGHRLRVEILPAQGSADHPNAALLALIAQWEKEDDALTPEEREKASAAYQEIEKHGIPRIRI